jgi:energy-coupling factor transporter ATP-binding protein EcfA2
VDTILSFRAVARDFYTRRRVVHAVAEVSLDVAPGEFLTVVGPSGCGKSTLLNMIAGLLPPSDGEILYKGVLKIGVPFALIGAIIGEFMASSRGLGYMIQLNTNQFDTTGAVSGILILMVAVMLFNALLNRLERYVLRWRPRERAEQARELQ